MVNLYTFDFLDVERGENISLIDGDSIHYSSAINYDPYSFSKGMIVSADGLDSSNNKVTLSWTIQWTNQCGVEPNLEHVGLGWFVFVSPIDLLLHFFNIYKP